MMRLNTLPCTVGKHKWRQGRSVGYAGYEEGSRTCENCGQQETTYGAKSYDPPYWNTGSTVIRPGNYAGAPEVGTRSRDGVYETRQEKQQREALEKIASHEAEKKRKLRRIESLRAEADAIEEELRRGR